MTTRMPRRALVALVVPLLALLAACNGMGAADYPDRKIQLIFPFAAGSPGDVSARALSKHAEKTLGQQIEVVNKPGAAGSIGVTEIIQAKPDGYTVGFVPIAAMAVQPQRSELAYEGTDQYKPVIMISKQPEVLFVQADSPWKTLDDLLAAAKKDKVKMASSGRGTILDIDARLLAKQAGAKFSSVPFDGEKQVVSSTVGGTTQAGVSGATAVLPFVRAGKVRPLATFTDEPLEFLSNVPTVKSKGYDITYGVDNFVIVPEDTPDEVVDALHGAFRKAMKTKDYQQFLEKNGYVAQYMGPEKLGKYLDEQYKAYGKVVDELGLAGK